WGGEVVRQRGGVGVRQAAAQLQGLRALHGDHARLGGLVGDVYLFAGLVLGEPVDDLGPVGGVDDHGVAVGPAVDGDVIFHAAIGVADQAVADLAVLEGGGVVGVDLLDEGEGVGAGEGQPAHVADVEQAGGGAYGGVLVGDAGVLHRHVPAGEVDHAAA